MIFNYFLMLWALQMIPVSILAWMAGNWFQKSAWKVFVAGLLLGLLGSALVAALLPREEACPETGTRTTAWPTQNQMAWAFCAIMVAASVWMLATMSLRWRDQVKERDAKRAILLPHK